MIKGIIFDLDGTILDTVEDIKNSINLTLKDFNLNPISYEETKQKTGSGFKMLMQRAFPLNSDDATIDSAVEKFTYYYDLNYDKTTKAYKGINELIDYLLDHNYLIGINSNKKQEYTKKLVKKHFPNINQDYVFGKREGLPVKPDPINNLEIIKLMNLKHSEVLYVGDSDIDCKTARNSNLKLCAVSWGFRDKEILRQYNPDYLVDNPKEIINILEKEK